MDIQKDGYELIKEVTGRTWLAKAAVWAGLFILFGTALVLAGTIAYGVNKYAIAPLLANVPRSSWSGALQSPAMVSALVTLALFGLFGYLAFRWLKGWQKLTHAAIDLYIGDLPKRVDYLSEHSASLESLSQIETTVKRSIIELDLRLTKLEPPATSSGAGYSYEVNQAAPSVQELLSKMIAEGTLQKDKK